MKGQRWLNKSLLIAGALLLVVHCSTDNGAACPDATCNDYVTQQQAQAAFDADKNCLKGLDADNDGIACEHLPSSGGSTGCPTTANCGCSGKNMSDCASNCCKWVTGQGCKCK